jgi:hypothetical protein
VYYVRDKATARITVSIFIRICNVNFSLYPLKYLGKKKDKKRKVAGENSFSMKFEIRQHPPSQHLIKHQTNGMLQTQPYKFLLSIEYTMLQ